MKNPGQIDYESDVKRRPRYHDGSPRKSWDQLDEVSRWSWGRRVATSPAGALSSTVESASKHHPMRSAELPEPERV